MTCQSCTAMVVTYVQVYQHDTHCKCVYVTWGFQSTVQQYMMMYLERAFQLFWKVVLNTLLQCFRIGIYFPYGAWYMGQQICRFLYKPGIIWSKWQLSCHNRSQTLLYWQPRRFLGTMWATHTLFQQLLLSLSWAYNVYCSSCVSNIPLRVCDDILLVRYSNSKVHRKHACSHVWMLNRVFWNDDGDSSFCVEYFLCWGHTWQTVHRLAKYKYL